MGGKEELRALNAKYLREAVRNAENLARKAREMINDDPLDSASDIIAALHTVGGLSHLVRDVMEKQGGVIFSRNGEAGDFSLPTSDPADASPALAPGEPTRVSEDEAEQPVPQEDLNRPKTFGELLIRRIDTELLPEERTTFVSEDLYEIVGSALGIKKALKKEGLSPKQKEIVREEAVRVIAEYLITPKGSFIPRHSYERTRFIMPFLPIHAGELNRWSEEIGHNWIQIPEVDHETAMQIRGLSVLKKILDKNYSQ